MWRINGRVSLIEVETSVARTERRGGGLSQDRSNDSGEKWILEIER